MASIIDINIPNHYVGTGPAGTRAEAASASNNCPQLRCRTRWERAPRAPLAPHGARFAVAEDAQRHDLGLTTTRNPGGVGLTETAMSRSIKFAKAGGP